MGRKVRIVPIAGANEPVELDLPENTSVGEAIVQAFPNVRASDLVVQDQESRTISPSSHVGNTHEIRFMPLTTGGLCNGT